MLSLLYQKRRISLCSFKVRILYFNHLVIGSLDALPRFRLRLLRDTKFSIQNLAHWNLLDEKCDNETKVLRTR
jgi:hypothetical protein